MKTAMLTIFFALLLAPAVLSQTGNSDEPFPAVINATLINQQPDPVGPGEMVEVSFRVENKGQRPANNVQVQLMPQYPYSLPAGDAAAKNIGSLESLQTGDDGAVVKYRLLVDKDAPDGYHDIVLRYRAEGMSGYAAYEPFEIKVQSHNAILAIDKVFSVPTITAPGDKTKLVLELRNYATSLLKDIIVKLDLTDLPLSPIGSSNEKVLQTIDAQQTEQVIFEIIADPDAEPGIYKLPVEIGYSDVLGQNISKTNTVSLIIGDHPDVIVTLDSTDIYTAPGSGEVTIRFVNKGTTDIKFLNVVVEEGASYRVVGSDEEYIGNLDSDDFSTASFRLLTDEAEGSIGIPVSLTYMDANNNNYADTVNLTLPLYSGSDAKRINGNGGSAALWIVLLLVAGAGFWWYRRRKRRRKK